MPASGLLRSLLADTTPLEHPHFRRLWTANIITVIGAQLNIIVVPYQIYDITDSSAYVGLAGAFGLVPLVIFGLYGGALSDRMDRTKLLRITTVGMIVSALAFWAQAASGLDNVWLLLSVFALQQAFFAVNQPTRTTVIARIVPVGKIGAATSLNMTVMQAGAIVEATNVTTEVNTHCSVALCSRSPATPGSTSSTRSVCSPPSGRC